MKQGTDSFSPLFFYLLKFLCCELYYKVDVVGLVFCVGCRAVPAYCAAFPAAVDYYISLLCISFDLDRLKLSAALAGSVAGIFVHVKRPKAKRAMVSRRIAERFDLPAAVSADKSVIIFPKSLFFHVSSHNTAPRLARSCYRRSSNIPYPLYRSADTADPPNDSGIRAGICSP